MDSQELQEIIGWINSTASFKIRSIHFGRTDPLNNPHQCSLEAQMILPRSWCMLDLMYHPADSETAQSQTPCTPGCYSPGCSWLPGLCEHNSFPIDTSCQLQYLGAFPPAGSL